MSENGCMGVWEWVKCVGVRTDVWVYENGLVGVYIIIPTMVK